MLVGKKLFQIVIMHRGSNVYTVAAYDLIAAIGIAAKWFVEHRRPDMEWKIISAKRLSFRGVIYDTEEVE